MNVSMNNCYYSPRVERENRETKPEVRSSKVDKRNGALCTQREHALARRQKECVINSVKRGRRGRSVTKRLKSREECRVFISLHPWWCHCIASHSLCSLRTISNYERNRILHDVRTDNIQPIHFLQNERRNDFDHRLRHFNSQFCKYLKKKRGLKWEGNDISIVTHPNNVYRFDNSWFSLVIDQRLALGLSRLKENSFSNTNFDNIHFLLLFTISFLSVSFLFILFTVKNRSSHTKNIKLKLSQLPATGYLIRFIIKFAFFLTHRSSK